MVRDPNLLSIRIPKHCGTHPHPDTQAAHSLCHNNLALRQNRDFSAADLESSVNLGFFGDSFVENVNMKAQFSFTEPLDYLLNLGGEGAFNVLNFGVNDYGTSQSLLRYELWDLRESLDHVFYVYCENDPGNDLASGLFRLDDAGRLARGEQAPSRFALLSKLHLSYLALDAAGRLFAHFEEIAANAKRLKRGEYRRRRDLYRHQGLPHSAFALFRQLLRRFKEAVESNGASFHLVWLPMEDYDAPGVAAIVGEEGVATFSLRDCFGERDPAHLRTPWLASPYRFEGDLHWNEAGNRLAAVCLHWFLEGRLGLLRLSEEEVAQALRRYYSAFEAPGSAKGAPLAGKAPKAQPASPTKTAIRRKYGGGGGGWALPGRPRRTSWRFAPTSTFTCMMAGWPTSKRAAHRPISTDVSSCMFGRPMSGTCRRRDWRMASTTWISGRSSATQPARSGGNCPTMGLSASQPGSFPWTETEATRTFGGQSRSCREAEFAAVGCPNLPCASLKN